MGGTGRPLFSIIIPTFNAEQYIARSIDSLMTQTLKEFECLIMDGDSSDKTLAIANKIIADDSRFKIYSKSDAGVYYAMNQGIKKSKGRYLYFLGADDYLMDNSVLQDVRNALMYEKIDVIYGNVYSLELGFAYDGKFSNIKIATKNICHQAIFCARSVYEKVGVFDLKYKIQADWEHNWRWFFHNGITHKYFNRTIAYYEKDGLSSGKMDIKFRRDFVKKFIQNTHPQLNFIQAHFTLLRSFILKSVQLNRG